MHMQRKYFVDGRVEKLMIFNYGQPNSKNNTNKYMYKNRK